MGLIKKEWNRFRTDYKKQMEKFREKDEAKAKLKEPEPKKKIWDEMKKEYHREKERIEVKQQSKRDNSGNHQNKKRDVDRIVNFAVFAQILPYLLFGGVIALLILLWLWDLTIGKLF